MVHTLPDYTTRYRMAQIFGQLDSGELAARLGALSKNDRRGNLVWCDGWESDPLKWFILQGSAGYSVARDTTIAYEDTASLKITTGNSTGDIVGVSKLFDIPSSSRLGFETHVNFTDTNIIFYLFTYGLIGTTKYQSTIRLNMATRTLQYRSSGGSYTTLTSDYPYTIGEDQWTMIKLVIDWEKYEYVRVIGGDTTYDLSNVPLGSVADLNPRGIYVWLVANPTDNANRTLNIDNFIFTQNEA